MKLPGPKRNLIVGFDVETAGLGGELHRLGILGSDNSWVWLSKEEALKDQSWKATFEKADLIVAHNIRYDVRTIKRDLNYDFPWSKAVCTMVMAALCAKAGAPKDLLTLSMEHLDYSGKEDMDLDIWKKDHGIKGDYSQIPDSVLEPYTKQQILNTLCLYVHWHSKVEPHYLKTEMGTVKVLMDMEDRGVLLDVDLLQEAREDITEHIENLKTTLYSIADDHWEHALPQEYDGLFGVDFNLDSPQQIGEILSNRGFDLPTTDSGTQHSTSKENLKKFCGGDEFIEGLLDYREAMKLRSTYIDSLLDLADEQGELHPNFHTTVTRTGRLSCSGPNLQNVAGHSEAARLVRQAFVSRPHYTNYGADYSQIEFRLAVFIAQDAAGLKAFQEGIDFHTAAASLIFDKSPKDVTERERFIAKTFNFSVIYGAGPTRIAAQLGILQSEAEAILDVYSSQFQELWDYKSSVEKYAAHHGVIQYPMGRTVRVDRNQSYKALNYIIQGTASDITKLAMVEIGEYLEDKKSNLLLQIHDELIFEEHEDEDVKGDICKIMQGVSDLCPLDVDLERWNGSWADKEELAPF